MARPHKRRELADPTDPKARAAQARRLRAIADDVQDRAKWGAPDTEIADWAGVSPQTLKRHLGRELQAGRSERRMTLRQKQYNLAIEGDRTMLIFLGKVELGQREFDIPLDPSKLTSDQIQRLLDGEDILAVLGQPS